MSSLKFVRALVAVNGCSLILMHRLLAEVYALAHERGYLEVNVEDPAPGFQFMRDLLDLRNCVAGGYFGQFTRGG